MQTTLSWMILILVYYVLVSSAWSSPEAIHVAPGGLGTAAKNDHQHCHSFQHNY